MRNTLLYLLLLLISSFAGAQTNQSLDPAEPVIARHNVLHYNGVQIALGERCFYLNGNLTVDEADASPYIFRTFQDAAAQLTDGDEHNPMQVYIAPYVYWIDNPDDPEVRRGKDGREPFGMVVKCEYLQLIGLNDNAANVVLASNRGQTQGAVGNFTMFDFHGDGLLVKNLTMGNYCNVDLDYPLKPELSREKRMSAITQAHVAYSHGDKVMAENVHFISRLNMNPLNGAKRILFKDCHMESTDDALTGNGVYLNCTLDFHAPRPFWRSDMGGAIFLNCDFYIRHNGNRQYFCKSVGPLSIIDSRFHSAQPVYIGWTHTPTDWLRCYQSAVTLNGVPYLIGHEHPVNNIDITRKDVLNAYRFINNNEAVYNIYNLLRGDDDWDPLQQKAGTPPEYTLLPTCLSVYPLTATLQTGNDPMTFTADVKRHNNFSMNDVPVKWRVENGYEELVRLTMNEDNSCTVEALNNEDEAQNFTLIASAENGLECATELTVLPGYLPAPAFLKNPVLTIKDKAITIDYLLDLAHRDDQSLITWYRCTDSKGCNAIPVAVSRLNQPLTTYPLTRDDAGYYMMATVQPKHVRCHPGDAVSVITAKPISKRQVSHTYTYETDFRNFPTVNQPEIIPGFWTVDGYKPVDTAEYDWEIYPDKEYWYYGEGINGAQGLGLLQCQRGARLLYTPCEENTGDMRIELLVDPCKTAGQGFGSATGQYMDIYIKFDTKTLSGYGLRIMRTTKYSNAVDFQLMKYTNGNAEPISEPISTICYRTGCTIVLEATGNKLSAHAETITRLPETNDANLKPVVNLEAIIETNIYGGTGIQHTGTWGENATMLKRLDISYQP